VSGEALALFVTGKDVSHHVRRVVLDFIPRIEREAATVPPSDPRCLTCGATIVDAAAGACHECGAEDRHIGSQWLRMPAEQRPLATVPPSAALDGSPKS
jgi:hypothetical protein